jgi:hypothetical protein
MRSLTTTMLDMTVILQTSRVGHPLNSNSSV